MIEGRMQTRSWDAQDGSKKYRTEIIVDSFQFGPKREGGSSFDTGSPAPAGKPESASAPPSELETIQYPEEEINPDDIPF